MQLSAINTTMAGLDESLTQVLNPILKKRPPAGHRMTAVLDKEAAAPQCKRVGELLVVLSVELEKGGFSVQRSRLHEQWAQFATRVLGNTCLTVQMWSEAKKIQQKVEDIKSQIQHQITTGKENVAPQTSSTSVSVSLPSKEISAKRADHGYALRSSAPSDKKESSKGLREEIQSLFSNEGADAAKSFIDGLQDVSKRSFCLEVLYTEFQKSDKAEKMDSWLESLPVPDRLPYLYVGFKLALEVARISEDLDPVINVIKKFNQITKEIPQSFWLNHFIPEMRFLHFHSSDNALKVLFHVADRRVIYTYFQFTCRQKLEEAAERSMADFVYFLQLGIPMLRTYFARLGINDVKTVSVFLTQIMPQEIAYKLVTAYFMPDESVRKQVEREILKANSSSWDLWESQYEILKYLPDRKILAYCESVLRQTAECSLLPGQKDGVQTESIDKYFDSTYWDN